MYDVVTNVVDHRQALVRKGTGQRRIVIFNWRDMSNPQAGGAEKVTQEIARRWVAWGHQVTLFCAAYPGAVAEEVVDGVQVIRRGHQMTVHWEAYRYYKAHMQGRCDLIIDEVNTIPFFVPLYAREPVIMYSNQLAREVWRYEAPFPLSAVGYVAEPLYLQAYRHTPIMTISQSTEDDLRRVGLVGVCTIIPMSIDTTALETLPSMEMKESDLTLVFVGRVVPSKRVDHIVQALHHIHRAGNGAARLWIIGSWDVKYRRRLDRQITRLGLSEKVIFFGHVDSAAKENLMSRAHIFVMTSVREGWGLVVTEANILGTPAVVYDVPGLRDSTQDGETGLVCRRNTPCDLANKIMSLWVDPPLYRRLRERACELAKTLNWDRTAHAAWDVVETCL